MEIKTDKLKMHRCKNAFRDNARNNSDLLKTGQRNGDMMDYPGCSTIVMVNEEDATVWCKLHGPSWWQSDLYGAWNIRVEALKRKTEGNSV